jgi:diketogulonate reductase-like aldo/keto reductase
VTSIPDITLNNGQVIPQFGFGVFQIEPKDTVAAVSTALDAGYRHIDTAEMYGNEAEVGEAIARSGLDRGEVFVTSKLSNEGRKSRGARRAELSGSPLRHRCPMTSLGRHACADSSRVGSMPAGGGPTSGRGNAVRVCQ